MSGDETFALLVSAVVAVATWGRYYLDCFRVGGPTIPHRGRAVLCAAPPACALLLCLILTRLAADDVRASPAYVLFYLVLGAAWVGFGHDRLAFLGVSRRDDALERDNRAATFAVVGALVGLTLCFSGGNIGEGPGWWVVLYAAGLATVTWFSCWGIFARVTDLADKITIDRDEAAGLRAAGFLAANGLLLGRAVAGDWESASATLADFVRAAWPGLLLTALAATLELSYRPETNRRLPSLLTAGVMPALLLAAVAVAGVLLLGAW